VADFTSGSFRPVLGDPEPLEDTAVRRVLLCSGKIYYDLAEQRKEAGRTDIAILRAERLYPLPEEEIVAEVAKYPAAAEVTWVQEEPANMGAWPYMALHLPALLGRPIQSVTLPASSAPAIGSAKAHTKEHARLVEIALSPKG
jgi:multifunctional 2-oxoglutarate metabolism enzyme